MHTIYVCVKKKFVFVSFFNIKNDFNTNHIVHSLTPPNKKKQKKNYIRHDEKKTPKIHELKTY